MRPWAWQQTSAACISAHSIDTATPEVLRSGVADTATLRESAGAGFWVLLIDVRHSLDSAMEPLHPREAAIKELWPAKADEKLFWKISPGRRACVCVCVRARAQSPSVIGISTMILRSRAPCTLKILFGLRVGATSFSGCRLSGTRCVIHGSELSYGAQTHMSYGLSWPPLSIRNPYGISATTAQAGAHLNTPYHAQFSFSTGC